MNIITNSAQIHVQTSGATSGANINSLCSGNVADIHLWGKFIYVARRTGDTATHILISPDERWEKDIEQEGLTIIGELSDSVEEGIKKHENK